MRRNLFRDEEGSIAVIVAVMMLIVFGMAGFAFDFGRFFLTQTRDQMAADAAAFSAAIAYGGTSSSSTAATQACVTAAQNGIAVTCTSPIPTSTISTTIGPSPTNSNLNAAHVIIHTPMQYSGFGALLAPLGSNSIMVNAEAWAAINSGAAPCLIALSPEGGPTAIDFTGSAKVTAPSCAVESGGAISLSGATELTAQAVTTGDTIDLSGSGSVTATQQKQHFTFTPDASQPSDPYASSPVATTGFSRLTTVQDYSAASTNPVSAPPAGGTSATYTCPTQTMPATPTNYTNLTLLYTSGSTCSFTVPASLTVSGTLQIGANNGTTGNVTVNFPNGGTYAINEISSGATVAVIKTTGSTFNVKGGINTITNASELSFGCSGAFNATVSGQTYNGCSASDPDSNTFNIQGGITTQGATLAFGNGNFNISGGITLGNGAACGPTNTIQFGTGSSFIVTDTGITIDGGCFIFGDATNHDINSGSRTGPGIDNANSTTVLTFGTGTYTVYGDISLSGASTSSGSDMTLVLAGDLTVGAGANVNWAGPPTAPYLIATNSTDSPAVSLSGGSSGTLFDGIVYAPDGNVDLAGSAAINANPPVTNPPFCFTLVAKTITLSGGTSAASACPGSGNGSNLNSVSLVQ
jgi:Flp pilus assembly protein TadG